MKKNNGQKSIILCFWHQEYNKWQNISSLFGAKLIITHIYYRLSEVFTASD